MIYSTFSHIISVLLIILLKIVYDVVWVNFVVLTKILLCAN